MGQLFLDHRHGERVQIVIVGVVVALILLGATWLVRHPPRREGAAGNVLT